MTRSFLVKNRIYNKYFSWRCRLYLNKKRIFITAVVTLYNKYEVFSRQSNFPSNAQTRKFFTTHVVFFFQSQNIRLINPVISKTHVHKCISNHGGGCRTPCTLDIRYGLIPLRWSNIVNPSIPSKPRWFTRFGWNMMKYAFYVNNSQSGGEGQVNTCTDVRTDRNTNIIG